MFQIACTYFNEVGEYAMGGREGAWGYLAQAVVTVINSLVEKEWTHVQIEPDTASNKVDIAWYFDDMNPEVVQVKSSKNNFTHPDIVLWLETLSQDVPTAAEYRLILIGTCSDTTKKIINRMSENRATDDDLNSSSVLRSVADRVKIQLENNDPDALESKIIRYLAQFLWNHGKQFNPVTLELMANALGYQFMRFSTNGEKVSRETFERQLLDWIDYNYSTDEKPERSNLKVNFYLSKIIPMSHAMDAQHTNLAKTLFPKLRDDAIELYEEINQRTVSRKERDMPSQSTGNFGFTLYKHVPCEFGRKRKEEFKSLTLKILGKEPDDKFFYVGNLMEPVLRVQYPWGGSPVERIGTTEEKEKYELMIELEEMLQRLESELDMFTYLDSYYVVPMVLHNIGTKHDKKIRVKIDVPKKATVVSQQSIKIPDVQVIQDFTGFNGILHMVLIHPEDSILTQYLYRAYQNPYDQVLATLKHGEHASEVFQRYVDSLFDFRIYEEEGQHVLVFDFAEINPKEILAFPCFLLIQSDESLELVYEITSQNLPDVSKGTLLYTV